jgi:hypothetical protein
VQYEYLKIKRLQVRMPPQLKSYNMEIKNYYEDYVNK